MARWGAVVMIHPAGLGGIRVDGHRETATANASWTASSARSMSPKALTRTATARPYSSRNTRSISDPSTTGTRSVRIEVLEGAYFDRSGAGASRLGGPRQCRVEVGGGDHPEPANVFLAFGERPVRHQDLAPLLDAHHCGRIWAAKPTREHPPTTQPQLRVAHLCVPVDLLSRPR